MLDLVSQLHLPVTVALAAVAALGYMASLARHQRREFTLLDAITIVLLMAIVAAAGVPLVQGAVREAKQTTLRQNLHVLRTQIEKYRLDHGGESPLVYRGGFPQLVRATDADGVPGPPDNRRRFGPYLPGGIPANSLTGSAEVIVTPVFPPTAASGRGGWLYHQDTGQIAIDLPEMLHL